MTYKPPPASPDVRVWLEAGLQAHRAGDLGRAESLYRHVLALAPEQPDAQNLLGTALLQRGAPQEAIVHLERAGAAARGDPHVLANLAQCRMALGRYDAAYDAFRKAARLVPAELHFQIGAASALALAGKLADAESLLQRLAQRAPKSAAVWFNLGNVMRDRSRRQEAIDCYEKAITIEPAMADAHNALGSALHSKLRFAEAEAQYRECIRLAPDHILAHFNLASVLMDLGRFAESESAAREFAARTPQAADGHRLVGASLGFQTRLLEAHACYAQAVAADPASHKAVESMATSLSELGRPQEALRWFARALALAPDAPTTRPLLAAALLAEGAIPEGWREYRHRHEARVFREQNPAVAISQGAVGDLEGKHLCVIGEQGLGDEIFFLRYAPALAARGARITYRAGAKIASLLERSGFLSHVIRDDAPPPAADAYLLAGDLPHVVEDDASSPLRDPALARTALPEHPRRISIHVPPVPESIRIEPLSERLAAVRERLAALGPPPYIGVTWRAGTLPEEQRSTNWVLFKSLPIGRLGAALGRGDGTLLSLQRGPRADEIAALSRAAGREVHDLSALNDELEDMLALLALLDEYVGVSNTNMHLIACAGRTARVMIPAPAEWRWMRSGPSSPWFPGFSIYRQTLQGDWDAAFRALEADLAGNRTQAPRSHTV